MAVAAALALAMAVTITTVPVGAKSTVFSESFSSGLGTFTESGRVYTGSCGARLLGGAVSSITSTSIDLGDATDLSLGYTPCHVGVGCR